MALAGFERELTGGRGGLRPGVRARLRRMLRRGRGVVAAGLGPVLAAGVLVPVVVAGGVVAGVAAVSVVKAPPAEASAGPSVLVLLQGGETTAPETTVLEAAGYMVTQATPAQWSAMSASAFGAYAALVIGDPSSGGSCSGLLPVTGTAGSGQESVGTSWQAAVTGNVAVLGTAPALPGTSGADALIASAVGYAAAAFSSSGPSGTGLYVSLNCEYSAAAAGTAVPLLGGVEGIGAAGGLTVRGGLACTDAGTVNTWEADAAGTFAGVTSGSLGTGSTGFPSPACPVQEAFGSWPAEFTPVAYDAASDAASIFTASDGGAGQPYVLLGTAPATSGTDALSPSSGGEVPPGAGLGSGGNAAAPGVTQAAAGGGSSAGQPSGGGTGSGQASSAPGSGGQGGGTVDTEDGDFTPSSTDVSVPGFGPSLDFTRGYDSDMAQQEAVTGTPGAMGYGWTDNWATSLDPASPTPGDIYTVDGLRSDSGNGGPPTASSMDEPGAVYMYGGNSYIADSADNRVEEIPGSSGTQWGISMTAGDIYTIAGSPQGYAGQSGDGKAAAGTLLDNPGSVAVDAAGDLIIADTGNCRVVEIPVATTSTEWGGEAGTMDAGDLYIIAGRGDYDCTIGDDAKAAIDSDLDQPTAVSMGGGNLYIADEGNNRVQEVAATGTDSGWGQSMTAGDVYTVAGSAAGTAGASSNGTAASGTYLYHPLDVLVNSGGMYITDTWNCRIEEIPSSGATQWGISMHADDIYTISGRSSSDCTIGDDAKAATSSDLDLPNAAVVSGGNLYIADTVNNRVQEVAGTAHTELGQSMTADYVYTIAGSATGSSGFSGNGGAATSALLNAPDAVWVDSSGNLYIADWGNGQVRQVSATTCDIADWAGNRFAIAASGNGGPATQAALNAPQSEAFDAGGDVLIADADNNRVQEIAASAHTQFGISMQAGQAYTVAGSAIGHEGSSGDGGPAAKSYLYDPQAVAVSAAGNLYIADEGNNRIQEVSVAAGDISTIAGTGTAGYSGNGGPAASAKLNTPQSVTLDAAGDVYIADTFNNVIREIPASSGTQWGISMTAGDIYAIAGTGTAGYSDAGGPATSAQLDYPSGVATDAAGDVYVADFTNDRVMEIAAAAGTQHGVPMTADHMYNIAGSHANGPGTAGDGGPGTAAYLYDPTSVAADPAGDVYIADSLNNRVQELPAESGTQWGQQMSAGDIYTIAGKDNGSSGNSGDGGAATAALMNQAEAVSVDPAGDVYVTDGNNNTLREVTATTATTIAPATGQESSLAIAPSGAAPAAITVTQPGGAQVTFYPKVSGSCPAPYAAAGQYCTLPVNGHATLTSSPGVSYTFTPSPGSDADTYYASGNLAAITDPAGNTLTIYGSTPAPGTATATAGTTQPVTSTAITCPATAATCDTIEAASSRALVIGLNSAGLVTSVTDPMGRTWTYAYTGSDLTTVTDPLGNVTSYTYDTTSASPMLTADLLTITAPDAQPGGPDAGKDTVMTYDTLGRVATQTDPMGYTTTFSYCPSIASSECMDPSTGTGYVTTTDPDGNTTLYYYQQGTLAAQTSYTGTISPANRVAEQDYIPDTTAATTSNPTGGTLLDTATYDGNQNQTSYRYDTAGDLTQMTAPGPNGTPAITSTAYTATLNQGNCDGAADESSSATCAQDTGPSPVAPGGTITPPASPPPAGLSYTLYDTRGNELYSTTGVYQPGASSAAYSQTTYQLYKDNSVTLPGTSTAITCTTTPPSVSLPCATISADGVVTQLAYNPAGDLTSSSTPDGNSGGQLSTTTNAYNADGEQTSTTAPDGNLSGANAGNYTTVSVWNNDGQETSITQAGGSGATATPRTASYGYDPDGNQTTTTDPRGYATTTTYNADSQATLVTDPDANVTLACYDGDGNTTQTVPPDGVVGGSLSPSSCPSAYPVGYGDRLASDATTYTYDGAGNQTASTTPAAAGQAGHETTTTTYDGDGNPLRITAPPASTGSGASNQITVNTYDDADEITSQTIGYGTSAASTTSYCYDLNGDQTSVVTPDGNTNGPAPCNTNSSYPWSVDPQAYPAQAGYQTTYNYDSAGELVSTTTPVTAASPSGGTTISTYDAVGDMRSRTDPSGITTTWTYTPLSKPATISYSGSAAHSVSYTYDADGSKTAMTDASGSSSYAYNPFGEPTSATNGAGQATDYGYTPDGQVSSITYPLPATATWATSDTVGYGYDHADLLASVTDFNGNTISIADTTDGLPSAITLGNSGDSITNTYDATDEPSAIALENSGTDLESFTYSDAPAGDILTETDLPSAPSPTYTYDDAGRVISMTPRGGSTSTYGFDASGNLTALPSGASGTYDKAGELTSATLSGTTTGYTYNSDGERLNAVQSGTAVSAATWNGAGELATYDDGAADMTGATYDGTGLRTSSSTAPAGGSATSQGYVWDTVPEVPQLLMDSSNAYIYSGSGAPAEQVSLSSGTISYLLADILGSVRAVISSAGTVADSVSYDAWGNPSAAGGLTAFTPFGYAGGYADPTGLVYLVNRYYDPATGQFISVDPDIVQTLQPYSYAGGNPVNSVDPSGDLKITRARIKVFDWWITVGAITWWSRSQTVKIARHGESAKNGIIIAVSILCAVNLFDDVFCDTTVGMIEYYFPAIIEEAKHITDNDPRRCLRVALYFDTGGIMPDSYRRPTGWCKAR